MTPFMWLLYGSLALMLGGLLSFSVLLIWALRLPRPKQGLEEFTQTERKP